VIAEDHDVSGGDRRTGRKAASNADGFRERLTGEADQIA
jgi:hypothetical protein